MTPAEYNRQLPIPGDYARAWRQLWSMDPAQEIRVPGFIVGMPGWPRQAVAAGVVLRHVRAAFDRRINARAGYSPREPRDGESAHYRDSRAAAAKNTNRVRVYQFETRAARRRLSHLLSDPLD